VRNRSRASHLCQLNTGPLPLLNVDTRGAGKLPRPYGPEELARNFSES
jgi:hypothetical protein